MEIKKISQIASGTLLIATIAWLYGTPAPTPKTTDYGNEKIIRSVEFSTLLPSRITQKITLDGDTEPAHDLILTTQVAGQITKIFSSQGELVSVGTPLLQFDNSNQEAGLTRAVVEHSNSEKSLKRARTLSKSGNISDSSLEDRKSDLARKKEKLADAQRKNFDTLLRSPIDGEIVSIDVQRLEYARLGQPLFRIVDNSKIIAKSQIPQSRISDFKIGTNASIIFPHGEKREGTVTHISSVADANTRSFPVEVTIENGNLSLRSGSTVSINVKKISPPSFAIAQTALIISDEGQPGIHALDDEDRVVFLPIDILFSSDQGLIVSADGLASLRLITKGHSTVTPGEITAPVEINNQ
jgi:multidrug efflux system membrane fusion protein